MPPGRDAFHDIQMHAGAQAGAGRKDLLHRLPEGRPVDPDRGARQRPFEKGSLNAAIEGPALAQVVGMKNKITPSQDFSSAIPRFALHLNGNPGP